MSHKHQVLLRTICQDPLPVNVHWRELESLLSHLGATIEPSHGARFKVSIGSAVAFLHHPHHSSDCSRELIKQVREFLTQAGISVSTFEAKKDHDSP